MVEHSRVIVYIDGFNLYFGLKEMKWRKYYWLDLKQFAQSLLKEGQVLVAVKYFSARISGPPAKQRRQNTFLEANQKMATCDMFFGHYQEERRHCPNCNLDYFVPHEKMTDVNIVVEMLTDAVKNEFDTAILVSGDSDLAPVLLRVRDLFPSKRMIVGFPPKRHSKRLRNCAHGTFVIGRDKLAKSQLPDEVPVGSVVLRRPSSWR